MLGPVDGLTDTAGIVALVGAGVGAAALILSIVLAVKLRRMRAAQSVLIGAGETDDLVAHAARLQSEFGSLRAGVEEAADRLHARMAEAERRLDGSIAYRALVRYDAYNEMSGRQSLSIALLDASKSGVVLSSIHHRDQSRLYAKQVRHGTGELELSPEEAEAVRLAVAGGGAANAA